MFLGYVKAVNYEPTVAKLRDKIKNLGCLMSHKLYFLHNYFAAFPGNIGDVSEKQGERFH